MKCYEHREKDALGTCRACGRGLCEACAALVDRKLACRNACEAEVEATDAFVRRSRAYSISVYRTSAVACSLIGVVGLVGGWFTDDRILQPFFYVVGGFFSLLAVVRIRQARRWRGRSAPADGAPPPRPPA